MPTYTGPVGADRAMLAAATIAVPIPSASATSIVVLVTATNIAAWAMLSCKTPR